jgi:rSAM/selenodomain-associated transferase 2/rSAM/selenodomain-associated transferase 1
MAGFLSENHPLETLSIPRKPRDVLIVMTRLPREGRNKTRLIPALGPSGATAMHGRLARHAVGRASSYAMMHPGTSLEVHLEGGSPDEGCAWLGDVECIAQHPGGLGQRMQAAADRAFKRGAKRVVIIGTDCPSLDEPTLSEAFDALDKNDAVYCPAADGGYVLVGLSKSFPQLFDGIAWGESTVLEQSLKAARDSFLKVAMLEVREDVDTPADLPAAETALAAGESISVIIPTLNEESHLPFLLEQLKRCDPHEIIIADGGSRDRTVEIAEQAGARVVHAAKGRASQMNLAAASATGEFLLFLHADTMPPTDYTSIIRSILHAPGTSAGAFGFSLSGKLSSAPLIERMVNLRCRLFQTPYGDQGLFLRRRIFRHAGRFPDWPVLEDLHMVRLLRRIGRVQTSPETARTSPRRWQHGGTIRTFLRHQLMLAAYHIGVPARHIAKIRP